MENARCEIEKDEPALNARVTQSLVTTRWRADKDDEVMYGIFSSSI